MPSHFKIIVPFYNVQDWISICIRSIKAQEYQNYQCILIDDMSTDNTVEIVYREIADDNRFTLIENTEKAFALKNIYDAIQLSEAEDEDIIVTLDGDDWFAKGDVLNILDEAYMKSDCWMSYGSYAEYPSGYRGKFAKQIPQSVIENNLYRSSPWYSSHLRTFKSHLWNRINVDDLRDSDGNFFRMAWDLSFMFPMLEMAGNKSKYIEDILYIYNVQNPLNDHKVDHRLQIMTEGYIRGKQKYETIKDLG